MAPSIPRKLGIKPGFVVGLLDAPEDFRETLGALPEGVTLRSGAGRLQDLRHRPGPD